MGEAYRKTCEQASGYGYGDGMAWAIRAYNNMMNSLKKHFQLDPSVIFLNHGAFGATPKPVLKTYQKWQRELERQPVEFLGLRHNALMAESRAALAKVLGTSAENLVYTQNMTISLNIVARSLELGAGDEVLSTDHESHHGGVEARSEGVGKGSAYSIRLY